MIGNEADPKIPPSPLSWMLTRPAPCCWTYTPGSLIIALAALSLGVACNFLAVITDTEAGASCIFSRRLEAEIITSLPSNNPSTKDTFIEEVGPLRTIS